MKTVIITGASKGIGLATTQRFLDAGWSVIGTYRATPIPLEHESLLKIALDLGSPESIATAVEEIKKRGTAIDVLVNNGGVLLDNHDNGIDLQKMRKTFEVDLFGTVDFTERMIPLLAPRAHIVNIASSYGSFSIPIDDETSSTYRMAKAALNMYTKVLAFRTKSTGLIVSSIHPGWVNTDMGNSVASDTEKPEKSPEAAAQDVFNLATRDDVETGHFWHEGREMGW
jgi:NAD(P)-dependent dehydrogenase (short-subunit alcohol dehydrogenase family)